MKLISTNRYYLPNTNNRFLHLASIHYGVREFICFKDTFEEKMYIEEITGGHLQFIDDDALAEGLSDFLRDNGVLNIDKPTLPDKHWLWNR
jgi:hypothetical protein